MFKNRSAHPFRQLGIVRTLLLTLLVANLGLSSASYAKAHNPFVRLPSDLVSAQHPPQVTPQDAGEGTPLDAFVKADEQIQQTRAAQSPAQSRFAGIAPNSWTWLGPGNVGGRIRSILPINATTILIGSAGGGIWKTTDAALTWSPVDDFMANLSIGPLVLDPTNSNTIYAGTGGDWGAGDVIQGGGIFGSTDGGNTWNLIPSTATSDFYYVNGLAISPDGKSLLAATGTGIWISPAGGTSWTRVYTDANMVQVLFDPTDSTKAVAATPNGALYSTDGGKHWLNDTTLPGGLTELAYAPSSPNIVYATVNHNNGEVWRSTDGGHSYLLVNTGTGFFATVTGNQGDYDNVVWVDPTDPNTILVGGQDLWEGGYYAGMSQVILFDIGGYGGSIHPDQHAIVAAAGFNNSTNPRVLIGNDGGIFTTPNIFTVSPSSGWESLNNFLGITQFYSAAGNATTGVVIGGSQDNASWRFDGNLTAINSWTYITRTNGDTFITAADQTDPNYFYNEDADLKLHRSTNGGLSMNDDIFAGIADANKCANLSAPFILDPNNPNTLLAGGCSLWRSTNVKATTPSWASIKPPVGAWNQGGLVNAIAVARGNSDIIWVGNSGGEIDKTTNGTSASPIWTRVDVTTTMPHSGLTSLAIDPTNSDIVYATYGSRDSSNVWGTADGGAHWNLRVGSGVYQLPAAPVHSLVIHPQHPTWIYVGTEVGIFASEDRGYIWKKVGPANVGTDELQWMGNTLLAATHGRGAFSVTIKPPPVSQVIAADAVLPHAPTIAAKVSLIVRSFFTVFIPIIIR